MDWVSGQRRGTLLPIKHDARKYYCPFKFSSINLVWECEEENCQLWDVILSDCALVALKKQQSKEEAERTKLELTLTEEP